VWEDIVATNHADEAMERYSHGDSDAFESVYDAVAPRLAEYLRRRVRDTAQLEDIIQQTFLQIHQARGTFIAGAPVLPWAFAIARRLMFDSARCAQREVPHDVDVDRHTPCFIEPTPSAEELAMAREAAGQLRVALAALSGPQRDAFDLMKGEGLSLVQTAAILGTTVLGVKLRMHRAFAAMRAALGNANARRANYEVPKEPP
jgi:RNA polymerase sigma-70 factor (ECF subfamily)